MVTKLYACCFHEYTSQCVTGQVTNHKVKVGKFSQCSVKVLQTCEKDRALSYCKFQP